MSSFYEDVHPFLLTLAPGFMWLAEYLLFYQQSLFCILVTGLKTTPLTPKKAPPHSENLNRETIESLGATIQKADRKHGNHLLQNVSKIYIFLLFEVLNLLFSEYLMWIKLHLSFLQKLLQRIFLIPTHSICN